MDDNKELPEREAFLFLLATNYTDNTKKRIQQQVNIDKQKVKLIYQDFAE